MVFVKKMASSDEVVLHADDQELQDEQTENSSLLQNWEERKVLLDEETFLGEQSCIRAQIEREDQEALVLKREQALLEMQALHENTSEIDN